MKTDERLSGALQTYYVYYLHGVAGQLLYIGRSHAPMGRRDAFQRKHKISVMLGTCQRFTDFDKACAAERTAIAKHRPPFNAKVMSSHGMLGQKHSAETKAKIGKAHAGKTQSAATRQKLSEIAMGRPNAMKGKQHTQETKAKMSKARIGYHWSEDAKKKMSDARKGVPSPIKGRKIGPQKNKRKVV